MNTSKRSTGQPVHQTIDLPLSGSTNRSNSAREFGKIIHSVTNFKETDSGILNADDDLGGASRFIYWRNFDHATGSMIDFQNGSSTSIGNGDLKVRVWVTAKFVPE